MHRSKIILKYLFTNSLQITLVVHEILNRFIHYYKLKFWYNYMCILFFHYHWKMFSSYCIFDNIAIFYAFFIASKNIDWLGESRDFATRPFHPQWQILLYLEIINTKLMSKTLESLNISLFKSNPLNKSTVCIKHA